MMGSGERDGASFRDPSGFVFWSDGRPYRHIAPSFGPSWDAFIDSGLAAELMAEGKLIAHALADPTLSLGAHAVLEPEPVDLMNYPYEWSFSQLRDAALLTLELQRRATAVGLTMRDASAFNITFIGRRPVLIDSLSFEPATPGRPWHAYGQFCEHFLGPLALMALRDPRFGLLLRDFVDGVPLDVVIPLLPRRTLMNFGLLSHLHLHARSQRQHASSSTGARNVQIRPLAAAGLLDSLRRTVEGLCYEPSGTEWADYAGHTSYSPEATAAKADIIDSMLRQAGGDWVWDLGANTGNYSRIAAALGRKVAALDIDPAAVERNYLALNRDKIADIVPLVQDLTNPSPSVGWNLRERRSIVERANADVIMALALIHHLAIGKNLPLGWIADFLASLAPWLIIEFVPKGDPMVDTLLATREDIFPDYDLASFRETFSECFELVAERHIPGNPRVLFLMHRRASI